LILFNTNFAVGNLQLPAPSTF